MSRSWWRNHLSILVAYVALTVVMTWPLTPQFFTAIPGDSFDGWQNYWNLWWVKLALLERFQNPFTTDILFAPSGVGLYFHTLNPFNGLATLPVQLSAGLIPAYNTVVFLSWGAAGYGVYLLTLYVGRRSSARSWPANGASAGLRWGAFVAGVIFTFAPFHMAHLLGHMQVMSLQWIPFYILYLLRSTDQVTAGRPWLPSAGMAGLFLIFTGLCDWYFVLYLLLFTALWVVWQAGVCLRVGNWRKLVLVPLPAAVAGVIFGLALSPILLPMVQEVRAFSFMVRPATDLYILSASLADFLIPNRLHTLFRPESFAWAGNQIAPVSERTIGLGYVPLLLGIGGLVWAGRGRLGVRAWFWGGVLVFFVLLAMGPRLHVGDITWAQIPESNPEAALQAETSPFGVLNSVFPLLRMSRSVSRYALMVQLAVAVLAGLGLATWLARTRRTGTRSAVGGVALLLVLAEFWVAPYPMSPPDTPDYYARLDAEMPPGAVLNLPMNWDRPGYLLYQTVHRRPLTVAYISRDDPRTATTRYPWLQHLRHLGPDILDVDPGAVGRSVLADLGVGAVVLDRYKMPGGDERTLTEHYAELVFGLVEPHFVDERITVYGVTPPEARVAYPALGPLHWGSLTHAEDAERMAPGGEWARWRTLGTQPAELWLYHVEGRAVVELTASLASGTESGAPDTPAWLHVTLPTGEQVDLPLTDVPVTHVIEIGAAPGQPLAVLELATSAGTARVYNVTLKSVQNSAGVPSR